MKVRYLIPLVVVGLVGCFGSPHEEYWPNGQLKVKTTMVKGVPNGPTQEYYDNGQLMYEADYVDGTPNGPYETYHYNGQPWFKTVINNRYASGPTEEYYPNGQLKFKLHLVDGKPTGLYEEYHESGQLRIRRPLGNYLSGSYAITDSPLRNYLDGFGRNYDNWDVNGPVEEYWPNGQLRRKTTIVDDAFDGPYEEYSGNGQLRRKGSYSSRKQCGEWFERGETVTYPPCPNG
jgi:antitoxin component YwqK of YwqJK toxin-antitoxin module